MWKELSTLPLGLAEVVATYLVAAGRALDDDPAQALVFARHARKLAGRVAVVREATGLAAYAAGEWSEALADLRAARRLSPHAGQVAVMADCERALARPEKALELIVEVDRGALDQADLVELRIVEAGARRDLGQLEAAVLTLQGPDLESETDEPWLVRLRYAHADNLLAAGRTDEAQRWFVAAADADLDEETDAAERAFELDPAQQEQ